MIDPWELGLEVKSVKGHEAFVLCPFHNDSNPSAHFDLESGLFFCFTCGSSANAGQLATKLGGTVSRQSLSGDGFALVHGEIVEHDITPPAVEAYRNASLATGHKYLHGRQVTDEQIERFGIRKLPGKILFPIQHALGVVGVQVRFREGKPKYKIFGERLPLWPFGFADDESILVEGVFGVLRADLFGIKNVKAVMSATAVNQIEPGLLPWRFKVCFDADEAGLIGAGKLANRFPLRCQMVIPGFETDELDEDGWKQIVEWDKHHNLADAASLCPEPEKALRKMKT